MVQLKLVVIIFWLKLYDKNKIYIGNNNIIGQAANVVKNIKNNLTVFGNPAK